MCFRLPGIASVVEQRRVPMVLDGFFKLCSRLTVKELRCDDGLLGI